MLSAGELAASIRGIGRLLRLRPDAFESFDTTPRGFWTSFWAAVFVLPLWGLLVADQMAAAHPHAPLRYAVLQFIAYVISWLAYPLLMVRISDFLGRWPRYYSYMVPYNWFQVAQTIAWLPLIVLVDSGIASRQAAALLWLSTHAALFCYGWFIARRGLQVDAGAAVALVLIDFLLGLFIDGVADALA